MYRVQSTSPVPPIYNQESVAIAQKLSAYVSIYVATAFVVVTCQDVQGRVIVSDTSATATKSPLAAKKTGSVSVYPVIYGLLALSNNAP